jgi:hypothetical protein
MLVEDIRKELSCDASCIQSDGVCDYLHIHHQKHCSLCESADLRHTELKGLARQKGFASSVEQKERAR